MFSKSFIQYCIYLGVIIIGVIICYSNILKAPFIWDDEVIVLGNPIIRSTQNIGLAFKTNLFGKKADKLTFYRPFHVLSYVLDYALWKYNSLGYHLTNILLHTIILVLMFFLLVQLAIPPPAAFIAVFLFAIHPVNTETVTYISARGDLLSSSLSLITILLFIYTKKSYLFGMGSILVFLIGLLSKETTIVVPLVLLLYYILLCTPVQRKNLYVPLVILLVLDFLYIGALLYAGSGSAIKPLSLIAEASFIERILTIPHIIVTYLRLFIAPYNLHMEYLFVDKGFTWYFPFFILGFVMWRIIVLFPERKRSVFLIGWFAVSISPFLQIKPLAATLREHWLYFPSIGLFSLVGLFFYHIYVIISKHWTRYVVFSIFGLIVLSFVVMTIRRNNDWKDRLRLYEHDVQYEPNSFLLHTNIGVEYFRKQNFEKAKRAFEAAVRVSPGKGYSVAYNNLGVIYEREGRFDDAIRAFEKSIAIDKYNLAYENLSRNIMRTGDFNRARNLLEKGVWLYPMDMGLWYLLGHTYYSTNMYKDAHRVFSYVVKLDPSYKNALFLLEESKKKAREGNNGI